MIVPQPTKFEMHVYGDIGRDIVNTCKRENINLVLEQAVAYWMAYSLTLCTGWRHPKDDEEIVRGIKKVIASLDRRDEDEPETS